jgi:hypothetical protein
MSITIGALIASFKTDPHSRYRRLSYKVRLDRDRYLKRIERDYGDCLLASIDSRALRTWYNQWTEGGKFAVGKALIGQLRALFSHGVLLDDSLTSDSLRLYEIIKRKRLKPIQPRTAKITSEHVYAIRATAKQIGWFSIALAQAIQFELLMRQKDVIGYWLPKAEAPRSADVQWHEQVWTGGLRWEEIDDQLILRHRTSPRESEVVADLKRAPMVLTELSHLARFLDSRAKAPAPSEEEVLASIRAIIDNLNKRDSIGTFIGQCVETMPEAQARDVPAFVPASWMFEVRRSDLPASGPLIICEATARPWEGELFRRKWRAVANIASVPRSVKNMDSRAGAKMVRIAGRNYRDFERSGELR